MADDHRAAHCHPVCRERPGLVRADGGRRPHRLAGVERLHQVILPSHFVRREGQRDHQRKWKAFGNSASKNAQGDQEDVQELCGVPLVHSEGPNAHRDERNRGPADTDLADVVGHRIQLAVERGHLRLALAIDALLDLPGNAVVADGDDEHRAVPDVHGSAGNHEWMVQVLGNRFGLTSQGALIGLHILAAQKDAIARDDRRHVRVE
mmetsp:Transcript_13482/g.38862  ORF Transcript_13482/g.38862 Transcript_13482/m.38862 type:complete len:207 (+) Transcript_13482:2065-2685(+)